MSDIEQALAEHGPLPRFGTDYIDCKCGWEAPRAGVIVWWTVHMAEPMQAIARDAAVGRAVREAVEAIDFKPIHPLHRYGSWRLSIRGPWGFREKQYQWWCFAEPYNATGKGLDHDIEGYGETLDAAADSLVTAIAAALGDDDAKP